MAEAITRTLRKQTTNCSTAQINIVCKLTFAIVEEQVIVEPYVQNNEEEWNDFISGAMNVKEEDMQGKSVTISNELKRKGRQTSVSITA